MFLKPAKEQIQNAINHKKDLEEEIGGQVGTFRICSVSAYPQDIEEVAKSITNEPLVLWTVHLFRFTLKLFNLKGSVDTSVTAELITKNQLHRDTLLRKRLFGKIESTGQIDGLQVSPTSHICRILSHVFARIIGKILLSDTGQEKRFWLRELMEMVQGELLNVTIEDIKRITDEVYKLALKLKIVESEPSFSDSDVALRLKVGARSIRHSKKK